MSIWVPLKSIPENKRKEIAEELTVIQLDESVEKMKKRGMLMTGQVNVQSKVEYFSLDSDGNLHCPYHYARVKFGIDPKVDRFECLDESLENKVKLLDSQHEVVEHCFDELLKHGTTTVGLPPGFGKTYIGAYMAYYLKLKIIVVVPNLTLVGQWKITFQNAIPKASIWCVGSDDSPDVVPDVIITYIGRVNKIPRKILDKIGTLIMDEAHMLPTRSRIDNLLSIRPKYIIMETADVEVDEGIGRSDGLHKGCQLIGGPHGLFRTPTNPYKFYVIDLPFINARETFTARGIDYTELCNSLSEIPEYTQIVVNIVKQNPNNKFIILTRRISYGNKLLQEFKKEGISADTLMGTKKKYVNSRVLIGTEKKIGTGFDEATASEDFSGPKSDSLIICHSVSKEKTFRQWIGRVTGRSENTSVYWLNVKNKVIRSHLYGVKKEVTKTKGKIIPINGERFLYDRVEEKIPE